VTDEPMRVNKAGLNILWFKPGIAFKDCLQRVAGRQHPEDMFNRQPPAPNERFASEYFRVHRDSIQYILFIHFELPSGAQMLSERECAPDSPLALGVEVSARLNQLHKMFKLAESV
jgi:hypothetical protein